MGRGDHHSGRACARDAALELCPPRGLSIDVFQVGHEEYALLSHDLPLDEPCRALADSLTSAERAVAEALLRGEKVEAIAAGRGASVSTVRNQIRSVYAKLGVSSRAELGRLVAVGSRGEDT